MYTAKENIIKLTTTSFCFIDYAKAFVWIRKKCGKLYKRWEYQTT